MAQFKLPTTLLVLASTVIATPASACPPGGAPCPLGRGRAPRYVHAAPAHVRAVPTVSPAAVRPAPPRTTVSPSAAPVAREQDPLVLLRSQVAAAKAAFASRNYGTALELLDAVVKKAPTNNEALQFRSMVYFALEDYKAAAADVYEALKYGNIWNVSAIETLYGDPSRHERQLDALRSAVAERPDALELRFLLAYQALLLGDLTTGEAELVSVLKIRPEEPLAAKLLAVVQDAREQQRDRKLASGDR